MEKQRHNSLNQGNSIRALQLQQLGRHRDRLLFGHDQSNFNHNGRPHYGDSYFYFIAADSNANTNRNGNTYSDGNGYSNRDIYTYT
jgi:hypothetical protein